MAAPAVVQRSDVWMIEQREDFPFLLKALREPGIGQGLTNDLDRDPAAICIILTLSQKN